MSAGLSVALRVLIPAVENSVAGNAFRPLDVYRSRKGLNVEIGNTDAEGRLILADALCYAVEQGAERIVDIATLTGARSASAISAASTGELVCNTTPPMWVSS